MARIRGLYPSLNPSTNPSKSTSSGGDPAYRKNGAAAVGLQRFWQGLLLALLLVVPCVLVEAQGNIFLTGHDIDYHEEEPGHATNGYDKVIFDYLSDNNADGDHCGPAIHRESYRISLIGNDPDALGANPSGWHAYHDGYPQMQFYATDDLDAGTGTASDPDWDWVLTNTDCLVILSHQDGTGASLTDAGVQSIFDHSYEIRLAFNAGMDLFVNTGAQCSAAASHGNDPNHGAFYLDFLPPSLVTTADALCGSPTQGFRPTQAGCDIGITGPIVTAGPIPLPGCYCNGVLLPGTSMTNGDATHSYFSDWDSNYLNVMEVWTTSSLGVPCPNTCDCDALWNYNLDDDFCGNDEDDDSVVLSLGGKCISLEITTGICGTSSTDIQCHPDGSPGKYLYTFDLNIQNTPVDEIHLSSPNGDIFPSVIPTSMTANSSAQFTVELSPVSGNTMCFDIDLFYENESVCQTGNCLVLPNCCVNLTNPMSIECIPLDEGGFDFSAELTNASGFEIVKMFIPDVVDPSTGDTLIDIEPNVIQGFPPVADGDLLPLLDLSFSDVASGQDFLMTVVLMAKDESGQLFECCSRDLGVSLPVCCNELSDYEIGCQELNGDFEFDFNFLNWGHMAPGEAAHAFLLPILPTNPGVSFEADYFDLTQMGTLPTVSDGTTSQTLSTLIQGAGLGQEITFELIIHNEDMSECCNQIHTITLPDCQTDPGGGGDSNATQASPFMRGDANTDGSFDIADVVRSLGHLFQDVSVDCLIALDSNSDLTVDIADSIFSLNALFIGGPTPAAPFQSCGESPEMDVLGCESFPLCEIANQQPLGG